MVIDIGKVIAHDTPSNGFVKRMAEVLNRQGQIEPLQVKVLDMNTLITFENDPHGSDIVMAARYLRWETILVSVQERYIP